MKVFQALLFIGLLSLTTGGAVVAATIGAACLKLFYETMITETIEFIYEVAKPLVGDVLKLKTTKEEVTNITVEFEGSTSPLVLLNNLSSKVGFSENPQV